MPEPKTKALCTVTVANGAVTCSPDPIPVSRASQNGVLWTFANAGYTFTGVTIAGVAAPTGDFGTPVIGTSAGNKSTMSVDDTVADTLSYSYTLQYTDPQGNPGSHDPTIRNDP